MSLVIGPFDQNQPFEISIRNSVNAHETREVIYNGYPPNGSHAYTINLQHFRIFQYMRIARTLGGPMTVCEVKLFIPGDNMNYLNMTQLTQ